MIQEESNISREGSLKAAWTLVHPSLKFSLLIGFLMNLVVLCGGYEFYRVAEKGPVAYCVASDSTAGFICAAIGIVAGLPFMVYGTVYGPWKSSKIWVWFALLAVLLNLSPFWLSDRIDNYVTATHKSVGFDGCD